MNFWLIALLLVLLALAFVLLPLRRLKTKALAPVQTWVAPPSTVRQRWNACGRPGR